MRRRFRPRPLLTLALLAACAAPGQPPAAAAGSGVPAAARRTVRIQPFGWTPDGSPRFGHAIPSGVPLSRPSGEPGGE